MNLNKIYARVLLSEIVGPSQEKQRMLAQIQHDDQAQTRKQSGKRYWTHTQAVSDILEAAGETREYVLEAAELHDAREDTDLPLDTIIEMFSQKTASLVQELTNDKDAIKKMGKEEYMNKHLIDLSDDALEVKLADIKNNMEDSPKPEQKERMIKNLKFLADNRDLTKLQQKIFDSIQTG